MGARALVMVLAGVLAGCAMPAMGKKDALGEVPIPDGKGQLTVRWSSEAGRSLLGSSWASANADAYELVLVGPDLRFFDLKLGSGQAVAVDPGTYRLVVLAGVKRTSGSATAYLVGSALADAVTVELGKRTPVDLVLRSIDMAWGSSGPAYWKDGLTVSASGRTRNAGLGMSLAGSTTTARPRFKSVELWNGYKEMSLVTGNPDDWAAEATGTVPDLAPGVTVALVGAGLMVRAAEGPWAPIAGLAHHSWYWPNRAELADTHPLAPYAELALTCRPPPTGVEGTVRWE